MDGKRPVALRAVITRINRKLRKQDKKLVKNSPRSVPMYGDYMIINLGTNMIDRNGINDIEALARELECLAEWEVIE